MNATNDFDFSNDMKFQHRIMASLKRSSRVGRHGSSNITPKHIEDFLRPLIILCT